MILGSTGRPSKRALRTSFAGDEHRLFVLMIVHQIDAADRFVVGGETDQQRADLEVAGEVVEDRLGVEIAPNRLAVVVRSVGMFAPDDNIREAEVSGDRWRASPLPSDRRRTS